MITPGLQLRRHAASSIVALEGAALPTSVRAFHWGWNDFSPKTMTFVSPEQARVVVARFGSRLISFDWEHTPGPSYGYGVLTIHDDGLYIDDIRWTEMGAQSLRTKSEIFISPAYYEDSRRWLHSMVNAALTSTPATVFARQLVAASIKGSNMTPEEFIAWLQKTLAVDPAAALEVLAKAVEDALAAAASNAPAPAAPEAMAATPTAPAPGAMGVPGGAGMSVVMASLLELHGINPADPLAATKLIAASANLIATERVNASAMASNAAADRGAAKLRAFLGDAGPRQPASAPIPSSGTDRQSRILDYAKKRGLTPEQIQKYASVNGFGGKS